MKDSFINPENLIETLFEASIFIRELQLEIFHLVDDIFILIGVKESHKLSLMKISKALPASISIKEEIRVAPGGIFSRYFVMFPCPTKPPK